MKKILFLVILIFYSISYAAPFVSGRGQFETKDGDSITFVKEQLLFAALKDVIDKELDRLTLEKDKFWISFDEKFNEYFAKTDQNLKDKYKILPETPIDDKRFKQYNDTKRKKILEARRAFWGLEKLISSYSVKSRSQSISMPGTKFITIQAKLDESLLRSTYFKLLKNNQVSGFSNLYLKTKFQTTGFSWDDLNVDQSDFKSVVNQHWVTWLKENYSESVNSVVILEESDESSLNSYLKDLVVTREDKSSSEYSNSLLLEINVRIIEITNDETKKNKVLELSFDSILIDLNVNKIIGTTSIRDARSEISLDPAAKPGSVLASFSYNKQVEKLLVLKKNIATYSKVNNLQKVVINGHRNLLDIYKLIKQINIKGVKHRMRAELESFTQDNTTLIVFFSGDDKILDEQILNAASDLGDGKNLAKSTEANLNMLTYNFVFSPEVE